MKTLAFALMVAAGALVGQAETTVSNWAGLLEAVSTATDGDVIVLAADGDYAVAGSGVTLSHGITVRGETGDPKDVVITDSVNGTRAFTMSHADARIEALTITGTGLNRQAEDQGGHIYLTAGTVCKCVIEGGKAGIGNGGVGSGGNVYMTGGIVEDSLLQKGWVGRKGKGGNIYMAGGTVRRCEIRDGVAHSDATGQYRSSVISVAGGVWAEAGLIDSCLLANNKMTQNGYCGGMYLSGSATAVNCTVVGSRVNTTDYPSGECLNFGFGVHIASANAKVINTVMYDNGGDAQKEFGTKNLGNYHYCASSVANASDANWKVIDDSAFTAYAQGDYTLPLTSKLVDAGTLDEDIYPADASTTDLIGNARVSVTLIDIGCYEADKSKASCSGTLSDYAVLEGAEVTCSAEAVGIEGDIIYKWDFGNGTVITTNLANFAYAYPNAGLFTVSVAASGDEGATWTAPFELTTKIVVAPPVMFVDSESENPAFPYKGKGSAAKTITAVLNAMTNNISEGLACVSGVEVRIVSGSQLTDSGMILDAPIVIRGESDNPTNVVISNSGSRAFTVNCADARIESLTITGKGRVATGSCGGHLYLTAGTVRNCIIENGAASKDNGADAGDGGNVYMTGGVLEDSVIRGGLVARRARGGNVCMTGGRVRRCRILKGTAYSNAQATSGGYVSYGGGVYISGGVLENCLLASNIVDRFSCTAGIYLDGPGAVVNCTVVGSTIADTDLHPGSFGTYGVGIHIANSAGRVVNTVVYDNGGTAQTEFGTKNLANYVNCASSVANDEDANESAAHWTTITAADFVDYSAWTGEGDVEGLRPNNQGSRKLFNAGTKWADYLSKGATSLTDLCGGPRRVGLRLDIGCLEGAERGLSFQIK